MTSELSPLIAQLRGGLIVSCQALPDEPLHGAFIMARMAVAAQQGGAIGIRANSPEDIRAIRGGEVSALDAEVEIQEQPCAALVREHGGPDIHRDTWGDFRESRFDNVIKGEPQGCRHGWITRTCQRGKGARESRNALVGGRRSAAGSTRSPFAPSVGGGRR